MESPSPKRITIITGLLHVLGGLDHSSSLVGFPVFLIYIYSLQNVTLAFQNDTVACQIAFVLLNYFGKL